MWEMRVYVNGRQVVVETNPSSLLYWQERKRLRDRDNVRITWTVKGVNK